jgi:hypothetical protein
MGPKQAWVELKKKKRIVWAKSWGSNCTSPALSTKYSHSTTPLLVSTALTFPPPSVLTELTVQFSMKLFKYYVSIFWNIVVKTSAGFKPDMIG